MVDQVTSHNQSGGITAKNVSIGGGSAGDTQPAPIPRRFKPWHFIAGAIGLAASVLGILQYFGIAPWSS